MDITIYSTTTCTFCHVLTVWLDQHKISYTKKITDEDPVAMEEYLSVSDGAIGVPFTVIKDAHGKVTKILGFDQKKFKETLGL